MYIHDIIYLLKYDALCVFYFSTLRVKNDEAYAAATTTAAVVSNLRRCGVIHTIDPCDPVAPRPATEVSCGAAPQNGRVGVLGVRLLRIAHLSAVYNIRTRILYRSTYIILYILYEYVCVRAGKRLETVRERAPTVKYILESRTHVHAFTRAHATEPSGVVIIIIIIQLKRIRLPNGIFIIT